MTIDIQKLIGEVQEAFFDIPFENSAFQTDAFVVAAQITPERAYRAIGLRLTAKLRALNEALFSTKKLQIDILELEDRIADPKTSKFDRMRAEVELEQKRSGEWMTRKLVRDAEVEILQLYSHMQKLPRYTREEFERGELAHFKERLLRQSVGASGAFESLLNVNQDLTALSVGKFGEVNLVASSLSGPESVGSLPVNCGGVRND